MSYARLHAGAKMLKSFGWCRLRAVKKLYSVNGKFMTMLQTKRVPHILALGLVCCGVSDRDLIRSGLEKQFREKSQH